jgi:hypothetical protein
MLEIQPWYCTPFSPSKGWLPENEKKLTTVARSDTEDTENLRYLPSFST